MKMEIKMNDLRELYRTQDEARLFNELLTYKDTVFWICLGFSKNPHDAEDLTQDVYLKAYLKMSSLRNQAKKKEWLYRIARNTCLDHIRKISGFTCSQLEPGDNPIDINTPESLALYREDFQRMKTAIQQLPQKQRDVFVLKEYAELSYQEIAVTLGIRTGTVMSRLNRARQGLMAQIRRDTHGKNN
jgi:RNA polymerase sigma-70 factor (ECF subfamily)